MNKTELTRLIEDIRALLVSNDQAASPAVEQYALSYAGACRTANDRLERCSELLRKGHRPEAIALSEAEPDLLQFVGLLNFPELDGWREVTATYGYERVVPLKLDVAGAVNDAYTLEARLSVQLRTNRRLALCEAPLKERLPLLREIAAIDVTTSFWREDIAQFEKHRAAELLSEAQLALKTENLAALEVFTSDFEKEAWQTAPDAALQQLYGKALGTAAAKSLLPTLLVRIEAAYGKQDLPMLQHWHDQWRQVESRLQAAGNTEGTPAGLNQRAAPYFAHLEKAKEQRRRGAFERDLQALRAVMHRGESFERVELLQAAAESHGYPLPATALAELATYRRQDRQEKTMSTMAMLMSVFCLVFFVAMAYFMYVISRN